jgi:small subunit ribosomal protein S14
MATTAKEVKYKKMLELKEKGKLKYLTKFRNRCPICGRSRGFMRYFNMCRVCFRQLAHRGEIPGVKKATW